MASPHSTVLVNRMYSMLNMIRWISGHPLTRSKKVKALSTYFAWQVGSRFLPGPVVVPFVGSTRLLVSPGMVEATYNMYFGLAEFNDMGLVLHALRPDDVFVDI